MNTKNLQRLSRNKKSPEVLKSKLIKWTKPTRQLKTNGSQQQPANKKINKMKPTTPQDVFKLTSDKKVNSAEEEKDRFPVMFTVLGIFIAIKVTICILYVVCRSYMKIRNCLQRDDDTIPPNTS